jgi:hypothetical protein
MVPARKTVIIIHIMQKNVVGIVLKNEVVEPQRLSRLNRFIRRKPKQK